MKPILLLLFAATAACVGALLPLISPARSKRLLLNAVRRASSDAPDGIGISVLCSGVTDAAQIENLLSPEYSRYEVIVVLDARRHAAEFAALTTTPSPSPAARRPRPRAANPTSVAVKTMPAAVQSPPKRRQNEALASPTVTSTKIGSMRGLSISSP